MIEIGEFYKDKESGEKVEVVYSKLNTSGDTVYACHCCNTGKLFWRSGSYLQPLETLLPVQQALLDSDKKKINIVACGTAAGVTTGFMYNILNVKKDAVVICKSYRNARMFAREFEEVARASGLEPILVPPHQVMFKNFSIMFTSKCKYDVTVSRRDVYIDATEVSSQAFNDYLTRCNNIYVSCTPSDIVTGYSVTTENGYYEVASCNNVVLEAIINNTGKIPQATPFTLEKYLGRFSNLITGYNYTTNYHLDESFGECVEGLVEEDRMRLKGAWVKVY